MERKPIILPKEFGMKMIEALESGTYKKTEGTLYEMGSHCALGVGANCNGADNLDLMYFGSYSDEVLKPKLLKILPECVIENESFQNIIMNMNDGCSKVTIKSFEKSFLVKFDKPENDNSGTMWIYSFKEIAQWMRNNVKLV